MAPIPASEHSHDRWHDTCQFPTLPNISRGQAKRQSVDILLEQQERDIALEFCSAHGLPFAQLLRAAWSLVLQAYTGSNRPAFRFLGESVACRAVAGSWCCVDLSRDRSPTELVKDAVTVARLDKEPQVSSTALTWNYAHDIAAEIGVYIQVHASSLDVKLALHYGTHILSEWQATVIADFFAYSLIQLTRVFSQRPGAMLSPRMTRQLKAWSGRRPTLVSHCIQDLVLSQCRDRRDTTAVCAWDGDLTYGELDRVSALVAADLRIRGVGPQSFVGVYFEKSKWALVALFSVLRAGGAFVLLDPSLPLPRLTDMCAQLRAVTIISAPHLIEQAEHLGPPVIALDQEHVECLRAAPMGTLSEAPDAPDNAAFAVFTSGSTGAPKGIVIHHSAFCSGQTEAIKVIGLNSASRVLQFSSYTFDVSIAEHLTPLLAGGCVCIPSEKDRVGNLAGAVQNLTANTMLLPPTVARLLRPSDVPSVTTLVLGGERITPSDVETWAGRVRLFNGYGPAECCVYSSIHEIAIGQDPNIIGSGTGALCWVVDPADHGKLAPLGAVGELLVEGPIVGRGYIGRDDMTRRSFVANPVWRSAFSEAPGGGGIKMYRTGDLVQYVEDGKLRFVGRRDKQVKIHGQRLELDEVEHHMRQALPAGALALADVVVPAAGSADKVLVGFTFNPETAHISCDDSPGTMTAFCPPSAESRQISQHVVHQLAAHLPRFMVPAAVVPLRILPMTPTGKTDRRALRDEAAKMTRKDLLKYIQAPHNATTTPSTHMEAVLCRLVQAVLQVEHAGVADDFFGLGGDSIRAMELARLGRDEGLVIPVDKVFKTPRLADLAASMFYSSIETDIPPLSLVGPQRSRDELLEMAAKACGVPAEQIEDIYPCTPLQEGLMAQSVIGVEPKYLARYVYRLPQAIDEKRLERAWHDVLKATPTLRTRIIPDLDTSLQVVVTTGIEWKHSQSLEESLTTAMQEMKTGEPLARLTLVKENKTKILIFSIHHALYDGWSLPRVLEQVEAAYHGVVPASKPFKYFVRHILDDQEDAPLEDFWKKQLDNYSGQMFPAPRHNYTPRQFQVATRSAALRTTQHINATLPTVIQLAWALTTAQYAGTDDVVFGITLAGRNVPVPGVQEILGPTLTTIPLRFKYDRSRTAREALQQMNAQNGRTIPFEHAGLQRIAALGNGAAVACRFQNHLVIQPHDDKPESMIFGNRSQRHSMEIADQYILSLEIHLGEHASDDALTIIATYDPEVITLWLMERIMNQFCHWMDRITSNPEKTLSELSTMSEQDFGILSIDAWDGSLTYGDLNTRATILCDILRHRDVRPGQYVMIIVERSLWTVVAMLAVMKAGAAFVLIDPATPTKRLQQIQQVVAAELAITSALQAKNAEALGLQTVLVEQRRDRRSGPSSSPAAVTPDEPVYAVFTSGSTGRPKGVIMGHRALATAAIVNSGKLLIDRNSRVLSFASFTFDASIAEILYPLVQGGCVCIPAETESRTNLEKAMNAFQVNWATLTPSLARVLSPTKLETLQILALGGEAVTMMDIDKWKDRVHLMNGYGPAECCIDTSIQPNTTLECGDSNIGWGAGAACWIVDPRDSSILTPPGAVGELVVEGPILANGYLKDEKATEASFIGYPGWLHRLRRGRQGRLYKTGDLVRYSFSGDGSLLFMGRKDNQVKLRGQRIELGEVEQHVRECLPAARQVVADLVTPEGEKSDTMLAVLIYLRDYESGTAEPVLGQAVATIGNQFEEVERRLRSRLPSYMVPSLFLPLTRVPLTMTGKVDRRLLRDAVSKLTRRELLAYGLSVSHRAPATAAEVAVQLAVCQALRLPAESVGMDNNFFHIGGDSIGAMKVVGRLNEASYSLSVADLFRFPRLSDLALSLGHPTQCISEEILPFQLTETESRDDLITFVAQACGVDLDSVEDIYPCTPMQEGLFALSMMHQDHYVARMEFSLPRNADLDLLLLAWTAVYDANPILRTRLVLGPVGDCTLQAVIAEKLEWSSRDDPLEIMPGKPLQRIKLVKYGDEHRLQLWLHHALYDGTSLPLIFHQAEAAYKGERLTVQPFNAFVAYLKTLDASESREFWRQEFRDLDVSMFPAQPRFPSSSLQRQSVTHRIQIMNTDTVDVTLSAIIQLICAIVLSHYTAADDVVYGLTLSGRNARMRGIEQCVGPTITTVPFRIRLLEMMPVEQAAMSIQRRVLDMTSHEQIGLQNIRSISAETAVACDFHTQLVIQPADQDVESDFYKEALETDDVYSRFASTPLLMIFSLSPDKHSVQLTANFDKSFLNEVEAHNLAHQLDHVAQQVMRSPKMAIKDIEVISPHDLERVGALNASTLTCADRLVHDLVLEQCRLHPEKKAISSWDGSLTYEQLRRDCGRLSQRLISHVIGPDTTIAICMEKSRWTVVATLAVLKAGAACAFLDPSHPPGRLEQMLKQMQAAVIVVSHATRGIVEALDTDTPIVILSAALLDTPPSSPPESPRKLAVTDAAFVMFTSGSTGIPKGITLEHDSVATALRDLAGPLNLTSDNRTLHFASYAFDASILEILTCLAFGGCLCIPSDEERLSDLNGFIARNDINWVFMIPSTSQVLTPNLVPSLKTLVFGGQTLRVADVERWVGSNCCLINVYSPAECTPVCVVGHADPRRYASGTLGTFATGAGWIVSPSDPSRLCAWGAIGELLIEGPIVGRGYINDPEKTAASFIPSPSWLCHFRGDKDSRLYRTGDLVQYMEDGCIRYVGRKDRQIKLRGQRIELEEVETNLKQFLPDNTAIVVELVHQPEAEPKLFAFVHLREAGIAISRADDKSLFGVPDDTFRKVCHEAKTRLSALLPRYMIPSSFVPLNYIPVTDSGKVHRRMISQLATSLPNDGSDSRLSSSAATAVKPVNDKERVMSELWAGLLNLPISDLSTEENFFGAGGDSISAMRLASAARERGYRLSVANVFTHPRLSDMADVMDRGADNSPEKLAPFELVHKEKRATLLEVAAGACRVETSQIEDIYPCTPLQEGIVYGSLRKEGAYRALFRYRMHEMFDVEKLKRAWKAVVKANPILRTRIIQDSALYQVVLDDDIPLSVTGIDNIEGLTLTVPRKRLQLGDPMVQLHVSSEDDGSTSGVLLLDIHHALYDGWSLDLVLDQIEQAFSGEQLLQRPFNHFVGYMSKQNNECTRRYWCEQLSGVSETSFPPLPTNDYTPVIDNLTDIRAKLHPIGDQTSATTLTLAWTLALSRFSESNEAVFGLIGSGRNANIHGIEHVSGPTITTVPFRFHPRRDQTVMSELNRVQMQLANMVPHEQLGLQNIRKLGGDAEVACRFQSLLLIQPANSGRAGCLLVPVEDETNAADFGTYALEITCQVSDAEAIITFHFDSNVLAGEEVRRLSSDFAHILQQIQDNLSKNIADLNLLAPSSRKEIEGWNSTVPKAVNRCVHHGIEVQYLGAPDRQAVCAWDGDLSYRELNDLSSSLASHLQTLGVGPEVFVPILIEKSKWVAVSILGVVKAGGAVALLDPALPWQRLRAICNALGAQVIVSSKVCKTLAGQLSSTVAVLGTDFGEAANTLALSNEVGPSNALYAIFTSGSTGEPKGIITEHAAFYTSGSAQQTQLYLDRETRTLQFASHMFDVSIADYLWTFLAGGCVCVPSSESLRDNLAGVINDFRVNRVDLTPSIARVLRPEDVPGLKTVLLGGEPMNQRDVETWAGKVRLVNGYGPSECSVCCALADATPESKPANIGQTLGAVSWVVDKDDDSVLMPVGAVGELLLEGPTLARGYLNNPTRTAEAFVDAPPWLGRIRPWSRVYKTGDLVRYNSDGTLTYVGRKDTQVKLRGQRVELGEIEHHICHTNIPVANAIVEVIQPMQRDVGELMVAFIHQERNDDEEAEPEDERPFLPPGTRHRETAQHLAAHLGQHLPVYMVPNVFIPLTHVPLSIAGKADRRLLRHLTAAMTWREMQQYRLGKALPRPPRTTKERTLQKIVADVLTVDPGDVGMDDNFFRLGGDSIDAIRLAHEAQEKGFTFRVTNIFSTPRLSELALFVPQGEALSGRVLKSSASASSKPLDLASKKVIFRLLQEHKSGCSAETDIVDILPVSQAAERYLFQAPEYWILNLNGTIDLNRLQAACSALVKRHDALRSIFVEQSRKMHNVVVDEIETLIQRHFTPLSVGSFVDRQRQQDNIDIPTLGTPITQFWYIESSEGGQALVVRLSHAQFDGYSLHILWRDLKLLYEGAAMLSDAPSYSTYLDIWSQAPTEEAFTFWQETLRDSNITRIDNASFGETPYSNSSFVTASRTVDLPNEAPSSITLATVVKVAWSLVLGNLTGKRDVVFAQTSSGRSHCSPSAKDVVGMCLNFIPVRVTLNLAATVADILASTQEQHHRSLDHELLDFKDIVRKATPWREDTSCQSVLVHQNIEPDLPFAFGEAEALVTCSYDWPHPPDEILVESRPLSDERMQMTLDTRSDILTQKNAELVLNILCDVVTSILGGTGSETVESLLASVSASP
ncbi:NRPS [Purpureocillium takamizusanense]|uniref:NRPS n=1 Tax=Purpureocillium takamizusanense TaxID=2060973 RepID=A0A9Q8QMM6_9HYPO|nr:NRPS [Purpureocillium takamizusanense]UNI22410.1 NRPS [Purpureocillium takamizusanense]